MRALKFAGAALAAVVVILALLLVVGVPSGFLTSTIQDRVERQTGYRLSVAGSTRIGLWPTLNVSMGELTLQDPKDRDGANRITIDKLQADMTLSSAWSGRPHVTEIVVTKPVLHVPLLRERTREALPRTKPSGSPEEVDIDRIKVVEGAIVFSNPRDRVDDRIEGINADATIAPDRKVTVAGTARAGETPLKFDGKTAAPVAAADRQSVPVEFNLEAPGLLRAPVSAKAELRVNGPMMMINSLSGALGDGAFNGWASVDFTSKPLVKLDLDFQRLDLAASKTTTSDAPSQGWSDAPINLAGLNYADAQVHITTAQLDFGTTRFSPASVEATLAAGVLKTSFSNLGVYGGQASGEMIVDASSGNPNYAMHGDIAGVRALPLLTSLADFDKIDGKMMAKFAVRSTGASQHAIMAGLSGTAFVVFQDGAIRGLNVAQMIRSLTASPLSGWQEQPEQSTDLTQLSSSFKIDRGQAVTTDFNLVGPLVKVTGAGTIDLGTKMMGFRVEPKLVMTTEGQGRASDPVGFGIPVMLEGYWSNPRIYPDMQGVLDNPDAAYAKLREMGKGLFGPGGAGAGGLGNILGGLSALTGGGNGANANNPNNAGNDPMGGDLAGAIGNLIQKSLSNQNRSIPATPPPGGPQGQPTPQRQTSSPPPIQSPADQPAQNDQTATQDSQPMNDVLRQLFNR